MRKFWSNLAVQLGKRAGLVSVIGLLVTGLLGFGITKLQFATGQDSYLNKGDQVAKDNVQYQDLFGGQIMIVLFTMEDSTGTVKGVPVTELTTKENQEALRQAKAEIEKNPHVEAVLTPLDTLDFSAPTCSPARGRPHDPTNAEGVRPAEVHRQPGARSRPARR